MNRGKFYCCKNCELSKDYVTKPEWKPLTVWLPAEQTSLGRGLSKELMKPGDTCWHLHLWAWAYSLVVHPTLWVRVWKDRIVLWLLNDRYDFFTNIRCFSCHLSRPGGVQLVCQGQQTAGQRGGCSSEVVFPLINLLHRVQKFSPADSMDSFFLVLAADPLQGPQAHLGGAAALHGTYIQIELQERYFHNTDL